MPTVDRKSKKKEPRRLSKQQQKAADNSRRYFETIAAAKEGETSLNRCNITAIDDYLNSLSEDFDPEKIISVCRPLRIRIEFDLLPSVRSYIVDELQKRYQVTNVPKPSDKSLKAYIAAQIIMQRDLQKVDQSSDRFVRANNALQNYGNLCFTIDKAPSHLIIFENGSLQLVNWKTKLDCKPEIVLKAIASYVEVSKTSIIPPLLKQYRPAVQQMLF